MALPPSAEAGATVPRTPGIKVVGASPGIRGKLLVTFRYVTCRVDTAGFHAYSRAGEWITARAAVAGSTTAPCYTPPRRR